MSQKVVLAYSGGLDTACILKVLEERGWDVVAFVADVGQQEDFEDIARRARATGASEVVVSDLKREFVTDFIFPAIAGNAVYENRYLLGTSLARPLIAREQVQVARATGATAVAHGATGKGNDQVRFELGYAALAPDLEIIAPWKEREFLDRFQGRVDLLAYAAEHGIEVEASAEKPFSTDENLMHRSYESGILEDPFTAPPADIFKLTGSAKDAPDQPASLEIHFTDAIPTRVVDLDTGATYDDPLELFLFLNKVAGRHGVGRIDMVENRFVGIKSRGVYETPGGTVLRDISTSVHWHDLSMKRSSRGASPSVSASTAVSPGNSSRLRTPRRFCWSTPRKACLPRSATIPIPTIPDRWTYRLAGPFWTQSPTLRTARSVMTSSTSSFTAAAASS